MPKYLTLPEVSAVARVPLSTVKHWIAIGRLSSFKPGRSRVVREDVLLKFIEGGGEARRHGGE